MSAYKRIETQYKNAASLIAALKTVWGDVVEVDVGESLTTNSIDLIGYDSQSRGQTAAICIRRKHIGRISNDLGYAWDAEKGCYVEYVSDFDETQAGTREKLTKTRQEYAFHETSRLARAKGYRVQRINEGGVIRLKIRGAV